MIEQRTIPFGNLKRHYHLMQHEIESAVNRVLSSGWYVLGIEVNAFEEEFAAWCGSDYCVGVANGTDALYLALVALGVGKGDEVITVANAGIYQATAITQAGAVPVFVDVDPITYTMEPHAAAAAVTTRTRALLPVHLYGHMAPMPALHALAQQYHVAIVEDVAQAHGAWLPDANGTPRRAGTWGTCGCFSFYPTKNLGALGDGGAIITSDASVEARLRRLRQYGWSSKYIMAELQGHNSRLDELQAAILRVKLQHLDAWNDARRERATWYRDMLHTTNTLLRLPNDDAGHVYHLYVITSEQRDDIRHYLTQADIGTDVHYPVPTHLQPAYVNAYHQITTTHQHMHVPHPLPLPQTVQRGSLPVTEQQAQHVLSLPLYPELAYDEITYVATMIQQWAHHHTTQ